MERVEDAIKDMIDDRFGSVPKFAKQVGIPASTIYTALNNGLSGASTGTVMPIVAELGIDPTWLVKNQVVKKSGQPDFIDVPLYGSIAAGKPIEMVEVEELHPVPSEVHAKYPDAFLLKVEGESMSRILPNGCYALVDPCDDVEADGEPYAVCVNGNDATVKRVELLANGFRLVPDSNDPTFKPTVYDYGEPGTETITIIGRVVWYCIPTEWRF